MQTSTHANFHNVFTYFVGPNPRPHGPTRPIWAHTHTTMHVLADYRHIQRPKPDLTTEKKQTTRAENRTIRRLPLSRTNILQNVNRILHHSVWINFEMNMKIIRNQYLYIKSNFCRTNQELPKRALPIAALWALAV